jgi:hypothetical protein
VYRLVVLSLACLCLRAEPSTACDRACLEGFVDQYLDALTAHDPARLPLARDVRFTENGQELRLGDGMWGVAGNVGAYKLYFADTARGQVGFYGVVEENGHKEILALRLKVENRLIREIETIVARTTPGGWANPDGLTDKPVFREPLAPAERRSGEQMIAIANSYFEGLEHATGRQTPFDPDCTRMENGYVTANNPSGKPMQRMTCGQQFDTGFSRFITHVRERRFPLVDEERGLVYSIILFDHAGRVRDVNLADGTTFHVPPPHDTPYTFLIGELFRIRNGRISRIQAVLLNVPYGMPSGWGTVETPRAALNGFVDRYMDALVAHDPSQLPLAPGVKFTENGQQLELGDGLWNTISARGTYSLSVDDPNTGQAVSSGRFVKTECRPSLPCA